MTSWIRTLALERSENSLVVSSLSSTVCAALIARIAFFSPERASERGERLASRRGVRGMASGAFGNGRPKRRASVSRTKTKRAVEPTPHASPARRL